MSQHKETLKFRIGLSGTFWEKVPLFSIRINNNTVVTGQASQALEVYEFSLDLEEDQEHLLEIRLENKTETDTIQNEDKTQIIKDMLLNIDSIEIDEIELGDLKWSQSEFVSDAGDRPVLKRCVNLGWNGAYRLKFTSPFYLWLLENM